MLFHKMFVYKCHVVACFSLKSATACRSSLEMPSLNFLVLIDAMP